MTTELFPIVDVTERDDFVQVIRSPMLHRADMSVDKSNDCYKRALNEQGLFAIAMTLQEVDHLLPIAAEVELF